MEEMTPARIEEFLGATGTGVLALASGGEAYALPLFYAREEQWFFFQSRPGLKDDFIDSTQNACLVVHDFRSPDDWASVQVFGPVERVSGARARRARSELLKTLPHPPQWLMPEAPQKRSGHGVFVWALKAERWEGREGRPRSNPPA